MRLIDILNKIANGELKEVTKVKWDVYEYTYKKGDCYDVYLERKVDKFNYVDIIDDMALRHLNTEVELIEPEHFPDDRKVSEPTDNTKIEKLVVDETDINCLGIHSKTILLNIIDRLNKVINKVNIHSTVLLAQEKDIKEIQEELDY